MRNISKTQVLLWWLAFVAMVLIGRIADQIRISSPGIGGLVTLRTVVHVWIVYFIVQLVAAGLAVNFVLTVARWQDKRYDLVCQLADESPAEPQPEEPNPFENYS